MTVMWEEHYLFCRLYIYDKDERLTADITDDETEHKLYEHLNTGMDGSCTGQTGLCVEVLAPYLCVPFSVCLCDCLCHVQGWMEAALDRLDFVLRCSLRICLSLFQSVCVTV